MLGKLALLLVVVGLCYAQGPTPGPRPAPIYDTSVSWEGFDVITSNTTCFLDEIQFHQDALYVAGEGFIHLVTPEPFAISHWPFFNERHTFYDFKVITDPKNNQTWAIGPVPNQHLYNINDVGMNYPFYISGFNVEDAEIPPGHYMMGAVYAEYQAGGVQAFWAGWHQHWNASAGVNFTLIRTTVDTTAVGNINGVVFNYNWTSDYDRVDLHAEGFQAYDRLFKPWMFHSLTFGHLVIVDPASSHVFRISANVSEPLGNNATYGTGRVRIFEQNIVSATYDPVTHRVYVGTQGWGAAGGTIICIDVLTMTILKNYTLSPWESNPTGMSLDFGGGSHQSPQASNFLYVSFFGGMSILKIDIWAWNTVGYVTLPQPLRNIYDILVTPIHVYFTTYEQHAKVGRVNLTNFCSTPCDGWVGYCYQGACACPSGYQLASDKRLCSITPSPTPRPTPAPHHSDPDHGGEVALGILFALAVVAAVAGWFVAYKAKGGRGFYESVQ